MNIPVTFSRHDGSDHFVVPVRVVRSSVSTPVYQQEQESTSQITFGHLVRDGLAEMARRSWSVQLPHRRFRRRQRARLRLSFSLFEP